MDTRLLSLLPPEQARCREVARHFVALGSIGCFAAALIEHALQRADRTIIDGGGDDAIRKALLELRTFNATRPGSTRSSFADRAVPNGSFLGAAVPPVGRCSSTLPPSSSRP